MINYLGYALANLVKKEIFKHFLTKIKPNTLNSLAFGRKTYTTPYLQKAKTYLTKK